MQFQTPSQKKSDALKKRIVTITLFFIASMLCITAYILSPQIETWYICNNGMQVSDSFECTLSQDRSVELPVKERQVYLDNLPIQFGEPVDSDTFLIGSRFPIIGASFRLEREDSSIIYGEAKLIDGILYFQDLGIPLGKKITVKLVEVESNTTIGMFTIN